MFPKMSAHFCFSKCSPHCLSASDPSVSKRIKIVECSQVPMKIVTIGIIAETGRWIDGGGKVKGGGRQVLVGRRGRWDGGHSVESEPLWKWRCIKPLLTWITQDKIFIYAIVWRQAGLSRALICFSPGWIKSLTIISGVNWWWLLLSFPPWEILMVKVTITLCLLHTSP